MNRRMDGSRLNIGTYTLQSYARSEGHIRDLSDCGIDFVVCMQNDRPALDLFEKYGVGAVLLGIVPGWWGGDGSNAGLLEKTNPMEKYVAAIKSFEDHPAVWGIDIGDEPSALDFPYYGKVFEAVNSGFENQFAYINLYPNYALAAKNSNRETVNQLGTATYAEHIDAYCRNFPSDYICYDFYLYAANVAKAYENLRVVSDACLKTGRDMWIVLQVNSHVPEKVMSENMLRFQAYSAMAFGAQNIIWACYTAGWWHNQVLDGNGEKTGQYEKLKKVNGEIRKLSEVYMKFTRTATHFVGFKEESEDMADVEQKPIACLDNGFFKGVREESDAPIIVGEMVSREGNGARALMVCVADDPYDRAPKQRRIVFRSDKRTVTAYGGAGKLAVTKLSDGSFAVDVTSNGGVMIVSV